MRGHDAESCAAHVHATDCFQLRIAAMFHFLITDAFRGDGWLCSLANICVFINAMHVCIREMDLYRKEMDLYRKEMDVCIMEIYVCVIKMGVRVNETSSNRRYMRVYGNAKRSVLFAHQWVGDDFRSGDAEMDALP
jgi:hypothetical protein